MKIKIDQYLPKALLSLTESTGDTELLKSEHTEMKESLKRPIVIP